MKVSNTSERLKQWLEMHNTKQVDILTLAEPYTRKYGIPLNKNDLSQYVSGKVEPGQKKLFILAKALNVTEAWLMGYDDNTLTYEDRENIKNVARSNLADLELSDDEIEDAYLTIFVSYYYRSIESAPDPNLHPSLDSYIAMLLNQHHWKDRMSSAIFERLVKSYGLADGLPEGRTIFIPQPQRLSPPNTIRSDLDITKKYRALDEHGTKAVDSILDIEYERCCRQTAEASATTQRVIPFSRIPASAGLGEWLDSENMEMIEIPDSPEYRSADFAVPISGDSMEPTYYDGDIVLVREQDVINIGDIGVFIIDGQGYIKELGAEGLISHNDKYAVIHPTEDAYMRCFGKVIGKL